MNKSMKQLTQFAACAIAALSVVACSSEDSAQQDNAKQNTTKGVATFDGLQPGNDTRALTRTIATYTLGGDAKVFWSSADKIFVQDDANTFHQSNAANLYNPSNKAKAIFSLTSGSFTLNNREVRYTGENGTDANTVTIASTQTQTTANDFSHLGTSGDCGTATAIGSNGNYTFTLNHKASYLCFVPRCMNTDLGPNIKLTKIKVTADQPIAGKYDFSTGSLAQKAGETYSNTVTLNTSDFSLNTTTSSLATNGAYMVVAPGTYNFTITYTIKDPTTNVEGDIVKTISSYNCQEGKINDITANLTPTNYDGTYYMWDAYQNFWAGHEWNTFPEANRLQLTLKGQRTTNFPTMSDVNRWFNTDFTFGGITNATHNPLFSALPNGNILHWYVRKGDPHWDDQTIWSTMGHLYKGGMWFKKAGKIAVENGTTVQAMSEGYYGWDMRTSNAYSPLIITPIPNVSSLLSKADYFYLPALGRIDYVGEPPHTTEYVFRGLGDHGLYPSSSGSAWRDWGMISFGFSKDSIEFDNRWSRYHGMKAEPTWYK